MTARLRLLLVAVAAAFFVTHAGALPRTLGDLDSINFAMGVESFDVPAHQPHPPGYPVFIAVAKASTAVVGTVAPSLDRDRRAAVGLAIWGLIAGTLAVFVFAMFWQAVGFDPQRSALAAIVAVATPLFWFSAARPLSDAPGLVFAVAVQVLLIRALMDPRSKDRGLHAEGLPRAWIATAFAAGLLIGFRSQTMWLTGPLFVALIVALIRRRRVHHAGILVVAAAAGALSWAVPMLIDSGIAPYFQALSGVGANDFEAIELLALNPSWRLLRQAIQITFTVLWSTRGLAQVVSGLAIIGLVLLAFRQRRALGLVSLAFLPYLAFHLALQEPANVRYAIPLAVPVAGLAVFALASLHAWAAWIGSAAIVIASLITVHPSLLRHTREGAPVFVAFQQMQAQLPKDGEQPQLRMHHQVWWGVRRALEWYRPVWDTGPQPFPGDREWLDVAEHWLNGQTRPLWFLGELSRTDLKLFDPRSTRLAGEYRFADRVQMLIGDTRLDELSWTVLTRPRWALGTGWALTPEAAGVAAADRAFPHQKPADAFLLRDPQPLRVLIGGRHLGGPGAAAATVELDGRRIDAWTIPPNPNWFVRWIELPAGVPAGDDAYARLQVSVASVDRVGAEVVVGLEQFDTAPMDDLMWAIDEGWNEPEGNPRTGRLWRWTTEASTIAVRGAPRDAKLILAGESPLLTFDAPVEVVVRGGDQELARFTPMDDFTQTINLPASVVASGRVTVLVNRTFVPGDRDGGPDRRKLGLRVYSVEIK